MSMMQRMYAIAAFLLLMKCMMRFFFACAEKNRITPLRLILYILLSPLPLLAFCLEQAYLPVFYVSYLLRSFLQEKLIPLSVGYVDRDIRVRFVIFGSFNQFFIGLTALLTPFSLSHILSSRYQMLTSIILSTFVMSLAYGYAIFNKEDVGILLRNVQKKDFKYLFYFLDLGILYIFGQSILGLSTEELNIHLSFFLCSNVISLVLIHSYLQTLYRMRDIADRERWNRELKQSLQKGKERMQHLLINVHFDELTGARSRLFLIQESTRLLDSQIPFALVYIDLNGLKKINDSYGHRAGDRYLCRFVQMMQGQIRQDDILARFGGDEFILIFPKCNKEHAEKRIADIQLYIQSISKQFRFAAGCADTTEKEELDALIALADQRMYQKKERGRVQKNA